MTIVRLIARKNRLREFKKTRNVRRIIHLRVNGRNLITDCILYTSGQGHNMIYAPPKHLTLHTLTSLGEQPKSTLVALPVRTGRYTIPSVHARVILKAPI